MYFYNQDDLSRKIGQYLKYYKDESANISGLESELNYIQDTMNSNSAAGKKLHLSQIKELTLQKISEKATALKRIHTALGGKDYFK